MTATDVPIEHWPLPRTTRRDDAGDRRRRPRPRLVSRHRLGGGCAPDDRLVRSAL
jgi:hypothetical protein